MAKIPNLKSIMKNAVEKQLQAIEENKKNGILSEWDSNYLALAKPTYVENWYPELLKHSIQTEVIQLSLEEVRNLIGLADGKFSNYTRDHIPTELLSVHSKVAKGLSIFPNGAFVRLGSRSPKDVMSGDKNRVKDAFGALSLLATSMRVFEDLCLADRVSYEACIVLREWLEIEEWREFRCFAHNGVVKGISQYFYNRHFPELSERKEQIEKQILEKYEEIKGFMPNPIVFDVIYNDNKLTLLEVNPYNENGRQVTDPCLFTWDEIQNGDFQFKTVKSPKE